jgi:hypothetical protein
MFKNKNHMRLSVLLGLGVCTSFLQAAEVAKPLASPSWLSRCASSVIGAVKNSAFEIAKLAALQAPVYASEKITEKILPQRARQQHGVCAQVALQATLLAGRCLFMQKAVPYLNGDSEKPLSYYALLLPLLALGDQAVSYCANYWSTKAATTLANPKASLWSWATARKLAGAAGLVAGSVWLASHMPILVSSFVFDTPLSYFSTNHLLIYFMMSGFKTMLPQNSATPLINTPYFSALYKKAFNKKKVA